MSDRALFYELSFDQVRTWLAGLGQPSYRAAQVFEWAYRKDARSFGEMTNLPKELRAAMAESLVIGPAEPLQVAADEEAEKLLLPMPGCGHAYGRLRLGLPVQSGGLSRGLCVLRDGHGGLRAQSLGGGDHSAAHEFARARG